MEDKSYLELRLYPNPTTGVVNIKSTLPTIASVYSVAGEILIDSSLDYILDLSEYPSGVYIIQVKVGERIHCERIIKQ
jgi:hypothetical protein